MLGQGWLCERFSSKQRPPDSRQFRALQALAEWRDRLARSLDESWNFVAPDACLWRIALALPATASRLRSTCNPLPQVVQDHAQELVDLLAKAAEDVRLTPLLRPAAPPAAPPGLDGSRGPPGAAAAAAPAARQGAAPPAARQQPAAPAREWPCSAGASGGPIVPVVCGRQRAPNGSGDPRMVLGSLFDGGSSSSDGEAGAAAAGGLPPGGPPPGGRGRVDAIRSALRFLPAAPAPGASAAEAAQRVVPAAAAGAAPDASLAPGAVVMAEEPVAPLGRRKRKRRAGGAMDCLESVVNAMAADSCSAPMLGDPDGAVSPATGSGKPAKKKKKRKGAGKALGAATAVDPYL
ncbi:unnamed protein product [Prorocentrum cordatum]|uniref:HRDC domain-containing protein n=1 Tax=Prorocentrum cordatum TaxID=2364126 RepID=A0ABN9VEI8_9DINO|nr:unnamed protein product [Polarella glacialis]